ncbi:hypothetical protein [Methylobacterium sp. Leaf111]|uniref:hypothetical protein n=1 Tax=Methylobacterium sp. Leaf111 TaxID=1736257 RepID=UPI0012E8C859|nr:hypothetical protein [Methylobacterium sp. Leaf111]
MPKQPRKTASSKENSKAKGTLSKVAGAGTGSGMIVWVDSLGLSPSWKIALEAAAPWVAIGISFLGPIVAGMLLNTARYRGTQFLLNRAEKLHDAIPDDAANASQREQVAANIREYRQTLSDILHDAAHTFKVSSSR